MKTENTLPFHILKEKSKITKKGKCQNRGIYLRYAINFALQTHTMVHIGIGNMTCKFKRNPSK